MYSIKEQIAIIIYFLTFGIFSAVSYTIFCFIIDKTKIKRIFKYIIEFIFWIIFTFVATKYLLSSTKGFLPLYGICFYICGIVIYLYLLDKTLKEDLKRIFEAICRIYQRFNKFFRLFLIPKEVIDLFKKMKKKKKKGDDLNEEISSTDIDVI